MKSSDIISSCSHDEKWIYLRSVRLDDVVPLERSLEVLSADEKVRAERFRKTKPRNSWIRSRASLRIILSTYLHITPGEVDFCYMKHGKPLLKKRPVDLVSSSRAAEIPNAQEDPSFDARSVFFNVSHSGDILAVAVTNIGPIGVDIERVLSITDVLGITRKFFAKSEYEALRALPSDRQAHAFLTCWTRKEAYFKATGEGLSGDLAAFVVSLDPVEPARILATPDGDATAPWKLYDFSPMFGYVGAVAIQGAGEIKPKHMLSSSKDLWAEP